MIAKANNLCKWHNVKWADVLRDQGNTKYGMLKMRLGSCKVKTVETFP